MYAPKLNAPPVNAVGPRGHAETGAAAHPDRATEAAPQPAARPARTAGWDFSGVPAALGPVSRLSLGAIDSPAEVRADRRASAILQQTGSATAPAVPAARLRTAAVPRAVTELTGTAGDPLAPAARHFFERRAGIDLSGVRVHTDAAAASAAASIGARAFAVGSRIVFGRSQYAPGTPDGLRLLAHELAHVLADGQSDVVHRDPLPGAGNVIRFSVSIDRRYSSAALLIVFIKQYRHVATDAEAIALRDAEHWHWVGPAPVVTQTDVDKGYYLIPVEDAASPPVTKAQQQVREQQFSALSKPQQDAINAESDREFWQRTNYKAQKKLGSSRDDKQMAQTWQRIRGELVAKHEAIAALPPNIRTFIFDQAAPTTLEPRDYDTVLRIVTKVNALSPAELAEFKSRVTATTTDWNAYESSIDRYLAEHAQRAATAHERADVQTRLYGLDALYDRYRLYRTMLTTTAAGAASSAGGAGAGLGAQPAINKMRAELDADLHTAGFPGGVTEFEALIAHYEQLFETETLTLANTMLEQYEHVLWQQQERYRKPAEAQALFDAVSQSHAEADYEQGDKIRSEHARMPMTPAEMADQSYWVGQRNAALARGDAKVRGAASTGPARGAPAKSLVDNADFDREALARAHSAADAQSIVLDYIAARQKDIAQTRTALADKPTMIYGLDTLLAAAFKALNVGGATIYGKVIRDHITEVHWIEAIPRAMLAVVAIGAGLLTGGAGTVAVLAAGTTLGIGAYQALEAYRDYEVGTAASGAQLLSDSPSFAWVIVALVGAGIDLAVAGAALKNALGAMKPAIEAFNAGGTVEKLATDLNELEKLSQIDAQMRVTVVQAAQSQALYRRALTGFMGAASNLNAVLAGPGGLSEMAMLVYAAARRGTIAFDGFMLELKAAKAIDESTLTIEQLARFKKLFAEAKTAATDIDAAGKALQLTDDQIAEFLVEWSKTPGLSIDGLKAEMNAWAVTKTGAIPSLSSGIRNARAVLDPSIAKNARLAEQVTAKRLAEGSSEFNGRTFKAPPPPDPGFDWSDDLGRTFDAMGDGTTAKYFKLKEFTASIDAHLLKANTFTVVDMTGYSADQIRAVRTYVDSLTPAAQAKIRRVGF